MLGSIGISRFLVEESASFDFRGIRLDWFRFQVLSNTHKGGFHLKDHREMASLLNQISFHSTMVDNLDEILTETSDLSLFWYVHNENVYVNYLWCLYFTP